VQKIRARQAAAPAESGTLESLVENEKGEKKRTATEGLMWLLRGLRFTHAAMARSLQNKGEELTESFTKAYEGSLKQFHNFVVKGVFTLAMKACPYRKDFYAKLGSDQAKVEEQLGAWLDALGKIIDHMEKFYQDGGHNKGF
ncbi:glycolipid transfer protein, partial [Atractiella rhizophila]